MTKTFLFMLISCCFISNYVNSKTPEDDENIMSSRFATPVNKFYSQNKKYFIKTIHQGGLNGSNDKGECIVINSEDGSELYRIKLHLFDNSCFDQHFLSDDGNIFCFISDRCSKGLKICNKILIFHNGVLKIEIPLDSLISPLEDSKEVLLYKNLHIREKEVSKDHKNCCSGAEDFTKLNNRRRFSYKANADSALILADSYPTFFHNDTLYIISKDLELFCINVKDFSIIKKSYLENVSYLKSIMNPVFYVDERYYFSSNLNFPDKNLIGEKLANALDLIWETSQNPEFHYKEINIQGFLYINGKFEIVKLKNEYNLSENIIMDVIGNHIFSTEKIPFYSERYYFFDTFNFRNKNDSIAKYEKIIETEKENDIIAKNILKDTLNGVYIPKDLYEAMDILDETVSENMKAKIKSFVDKNDLESYQNRPRLNLNSWPLNSRISHYLDSLGIDHFEAQYSVLNNAFRAYLKDETYKIIHRTYKDFVKDSNLFIHFEINFSEVKKPYIADLKIINKDSSGKRTLFYPFNKTGFYEYKYFSGDSNFNNYQSVAYDYDTQDFLELLSDYFVEYTHIFEHGCCPWDSLLFISDYPNNEYLLSRFRWYLQKDKSDKFMRTHKYNVYYNVGRSELDSIDNIIFNYIQSANKESYYKYSEQSDKFVKSLMEDFLSKKSYADFYVVRFYPDIKFDFKEYKRKKKSQNNN